ncbi:MAG: long-chain fatty acid--CoA ligase [Desulfobacterales bacterium]
MMDYPLLMRTLLLRAARYFPKKEILSIFPDEIFRYTYGDYFKRTCQLANALKSLGIRKGDRVASIALNNHRHLELYFGVPCTGAVLHTANFRLPPQHLSYVLNHAEDKVLFIDEDLLIIAEMIKDQLKTVEHFVVLSQSGKPLQTSLSPVYSYDEWISQFPAEYDFPEDLDEKDPAMMCYTSATTGDPKGVVYTHRSIVLHSYAGAVTFGTFESDCALHIVPMFHANAWGMPFISVGMGIKQILPGRETLNMEKICRVIADEKVTVTCGVPTIWLMLYDYLEKGGWHDFSSLRVIASGGSACPLSLMRGLNEKYNFPIRQAYGGTETSPLATAALEKSYMTDLSPDELYSVRNSAGFPALGVDIKVVDTVTGIEVNDDGTEMGEIYLRGPWIADEYYKDPERSRQAFVDGWFHTGDMGTIDGEGYLRIVDRTKDLVKSGGEWISSVDLENMIMAHPKVLEAAIIGVPDPKWQEVPFGCIVVQQGETLTAAELQEYLKDKVKASYWIPKQFAFINALPKTSVMKFDKKGLRQMYANGQLK